MTNQELKILLIKILLNSMDPKLKKAFTYLTDDQLETLMATKSNGSKVLPLPALIKYARKLERKAKALRESKPTRTKHSSKESYLLEVNAMVGNRIGLDVTPPSLNEDEAA